MRQIKHYLCLFLGSFLLLSGVYSHVAIASELNTTTSSHPLTAYAGDISKPDENIDMSSPESDDHVKACQQSTKQWNTYSRPICECVPGDTIIPTKNNKILSYLFGNDADTGATLSVKGWKNNQCRLDFKEGTLVKTCALSRKTLKNLTQQLLNPELFDTHSEFAQMLNNECQ